ncbi:Uncharacterised protein [Mycobacteroides abscessus subsp. massiliense]|nr:Uncharacterised protein [Mycobacteroides abscessus subsp. massiliense]
MAPFAVHRGTAHPHRGVVQIAAGVLNVLQAVAVMFEEVDVHVPARRREGGVLGAVGHPREPVVLGLLSGCRSAALMDDRRLIGDRLGHGMGDRFTGSPAGGEGGRQ